MSNRCPGLPFYGAGGGLKHERRTATASRRDSGRRWICTAATISTTPGSSITTAGCEKHYHDQAKSDHERAFKKHSIFSLYVSTIGTIVSYQMSELIRTPILRLDSQQVTTSYHHSKYSCRVSRHRPLLRIQTTTSEK